MSYNFTHAKNNCKHKIRVPILEVCANCGTWSTATIMTRLLQPIFFSFFLLRWRIPSSPYFSAEKWNTLNPTSHMKAPAGTFCLITSTPLAWRFQMCSLEEKQAKTVRRLFLKPKWRSGEKKQIWKKIKRGNEWARTERNKAEHWQCRQGCV